MTETDYFKDISLSILQRRVIDDVYDNEYKPAETANKVLLELGKMSTFKPEYLGELKNYIIGYYCRYFYIVSDMVSKYDGPTTRNMSWYNYKDFIKKIRETLEDTKL